MHKISLKDIRCLIAHPLKIVLLCIAIVVGVSSSLFAQVPDRVISTDGSEATVSGKIIAITPNGVEVEEKNGSIKPVSVEKIREIQFAGEPPSLKNARLMLARRRPTEALKELLKIESGELEGAEEFIRDEVDFVKAASTGRAALESGASPVESGKLVGEFLTKHANSHHFYPMQELYGDLLARLGKFDLAQEAYAKLAKGPPALRVKAAAANAGMLYDQEKYAEAYKEFENAMQIQVDPKDEGSMSQRRAAELGKAKCLARQRKPDEAIKLIQAIIKQSNPEDKELLGKAYAVLGVTYRSITGKDQDALISFLTVDLVYNTLPETHAEALFNLAELWESGKFPERAREAKQNLETAYPGSAWAKKAAARKS
ncbi:MAG: hypothetical protein NTY87_01550 [Planctomycetia bacterium]|nr:hypothetical protein [Planctomycetia bacterium]